MATLLNPDFLKSYQRSFSEAVVNEAYADQESLGGKGLLRLSPCKQLNFFVMKSLFNQWQEEMRRLESPYFDYKAAEVKKAMVQFMNVLSQHIQVGQSDIRQLIEEALEQCLLIVVDPAAFVKSEFEGRADLSYSPKQSSQLLKYIKVLGPQFHDLFLERASGSYTEVIEQAERYFAEVDLTEAQETVFSELSQVLPITLQDVFGEDSSKPEPIPDPEPVPHEVEETFEVDEEPETVEPTVDDRPATINDQFERAAPLVEHLQHTGEVASIMESISLNQRYMFAQELFSGDANVFQKAIGEIEHERSFDEAVEHLVSNYAGQNDWDMNSEVVKELLKAIFRKFR